MTLYFQIKRREVLDAAICFCLANKISFKLNPQETGAFHFYPDKSDENLRDFLEQAGYQNDGKDFYATTRY